MKLTKKQIAIKYRKGNCGKSQRWEVAIYDPERDLWITYDGLTYYQACKMVKGARADWNWKKQNYLN